MSGKVPTRIITGIELFWVSDKGLLVGPPKSMPAEQYWIPKSVIISTDLKLESDVGSAKVQKWFYDKLTKVK